jgi:hypothetical protein
MNVLSADAGANDRIIFAQARQHCENNAIPATRMEYTFEAELKEPANRSLTSYTNKLIQQ